MLPQRLEQHPAELNGHELSLMFAKTNEEHVFGLMFRKSLAPNEGMLFFYSRPVKMSFWMKYTYIPLDLILFDSDMRVSEIILDMQPAHSGQERLYTGSRLAQYALELPAGSVKAFGIKPGDKLTLKETRE